VFLLSVGLGVVLNVQTFSTTFNVCPDTEYCNSVYYGNDGEKTIDYTGFPFKIKVGNPDWCSNGYDGICEGGTFHPDFNVQYRIYNIILILLPSILLGGMYLKTRKPVAFRCAIYTLTALSICVWLGLITNDFIYAHSARGSSLSYESFSASSFAGYPVPSELSIASGCPIAVENRTEFKKCVSESVNYGNIWEKSITVYINWFFWSILWGAIAYGIYKFWTRRQKSTSKNSPHLPKS
jgi:hypothetical protein